MVYTLNLKRRTDVKLSDVSYECKTKEDWHGDYWVIIDQTPDGVSNTYTIFILPYFEATEEFHVILLFYCICVLAKQAPPSVPTLPASDSDVRCLHPPQFGMRCPPTHPYIASTRRGCSNFDIRENIQQRLGPPGLHT